MAIKSQTGSVTAAPGEQVSLSSLFSITPAASNPTYLIVSALDRDEYTAGYNTANMGSLSGNGATQNFSFAGGDAYSLGIVFTYQASTGQYYNATYGYFNQATFTASSNTNDNVSLSLYTTNNASLANSYAASPYTLEENPSYFSYAGSVGIVTQPNSLGTFTTQATPDSVCAAAETFVGKAWNMDGCWVLASNISAEAGASLPASSTLAGVAGVANSEWIVAYNGPVSSNANWEKNLTAGEVVGFITTAGGGHITTVVSGSGTSAMLVDNITYVNSYGGIENAANDGSSSDIIIAAAHAATQEFNGVNAKEAVVYELNTPTVTDLVSSLSMPEGTSKTLASLFSASNPVAGESITKWQVYDTSTADAITVNGVAQTADHSAANALTVASLSGVALQAGASTGADTIEVRAYNGSYWGDWQSLGVTVTPPPTPPTVTAQTAAQTWAQKSKISFTLASNTFTDPQGQALNLSARQANGQALPSWLSFNAATGTFSGTVPAGMEGLVLKVTATDTSGLSASESFAVTVPAAAPSLAIQTPGQTWLQGQKVSLTLAGTTFSDPQGEALTYTATQANGTALPSWLSFNAATRTFSGTAPSSISSLNLQVTATDSSGLAASDSFTASVVAPPTITGQTASQTWTSGQKISLSLASNTFTDPQDQKLSYAASLSSGAKLPSWLTFNAPTLTFSGTAPTSAANLTLTVAATDSCGLSTSESFGVTISAASLASTGAIKTGADTMQFIPVATGSSEPSLATLLSDMHLDLAAFAPESRAAYGQVNNVEQPGSQLGVPNNLTSLIASITQLTHHATPAFA